MKVLWTALSGFGMGAADLVPGVSGGTIALVLGIYERLIASVRIGSSALGRFMSGDWAGFRDRMHAVEWTFITSLGVGVLAAVLLLAAAFERLLHEQPVLTAAVFFGLVAGSVIVAWRLLREPGRVHVAIIASAGAIVFVALGATGATENETVVQTSDPALWTFFAAGAVAICAMILPGVSGSFLLIMLGMYGPVLSAVSQRDVFPIGAFLLGAITGLALFSQLLHKALQRHHDLVLAALIGLMAGSVRVLWPWPSGVFSTELAVPDGAVLVPMAAAALAFLAVIAIGRPTRDRPLVSSERTLAEAA